MSNDDERRRYKRLPKAFHVLAHEFKFPIAAQPRFETTCADISAGGLCVEASRRFTPGDKLQIKVHIPTLNKYSPGFFKYYENDADQYLHAIAEVTWVDPSAGRYMAGLRFLDVDEDACRALAGLITKAVREMDDD